MTRAWQSRRQRVQTPLSSLNRARRSAPPLDLVQNLPSHSALHAALTQLAAIHGPVLISHSALPGANVQFASIYSSVLISHSALQGARIRCASVCRSVLIPHSQLCRLTDPDRASCWSSTQLIHSSCEGCETKYSALQCRALLAELPWQRQFGGEPCSTR